MTEGTKALPNLREEARMTTPRGVPKASQLPDPSVIYGNLIVSLIQRRHDLGLTGLEVDAIAGWAVYQTAKYECGDRRPSADSLAVWVASLNGQLVFAPLSVKRKFRKLSQRRPWRQLDKKSVHGNQRESA